MLNWQRLDQVKFQIKAVATKRVIFLVQNLKRVGRDFTPPVPETFAMVGWSTGMRMVAVDVAMRTRTQRRCRMVDG